MAQDKKDFIDLNQFSKEELLPQAETLEIIEIIERAK